MRIYLYVILSFFLRLPAFAPIERELERRIGEKLEGETDVHFCIHATRWGFLWGRIRRLEVIVRGLTVASGLRLDEFAFEAHDVWVAPWSTYCRNAAQLRDIGDVLWTLTLKQADLERFLASRGPVLRGIRLTIDPKCLTLERGLGLAGAFFDVKSPLRLAGSLEVRRPDIYLELHHIAAFGISPPGALLRTILALVNPVVKAADINRMLRRADLALLQGKKIRNEFHDIQLGEGEARINGELIIFKSSTAGAGNGASSQDKSDTME